MAKKKTVSNRNVIRWPKMSQTFNNNNHTLTIIIHKGLNTEQTILDQ